MMKDSRARTALIRQIVRDSGYNFTLTFNDRKSKSRRIKMMQNGYVHPPEHYMLWYRNIYNKLKAHGIEYNFLGFKECYGGRGRYIALVINVPIEGDE